MSDAPPGPSPPRVPRLVIDTNQFVGLLFRPSAPGPRTLWERWGAGDLRVCVSAEVLREVRGTLRRLPVATDRKDEILARLESPHTADFHDEVPDSGFRCGDPSDDKFLHLTLAAGADALITSDRALLEVQGFPIPILKSGQWLRRNVRNQK